MSDPTGVPLSVLDLAPVGGGATSTQALADGRAADRAVRDALRLGRVRRGRRPGALAGRVGALSFLRLRSGRPGPVPTPEEAAAYPYSPAERAFVQDRLDAQVIGGPETVRRGLDTLLAATQADELMVTTTVHSSAERHRSFERVAALAEGTPLRWRLPVSAGRE